MRASAKIGGTGCFIALVILILNITLGGYATQYVVEFWGTVAKGHPITVPFMVCAIAGLFLGEFTIPLAVITWLVSFVM